MSYGIDGYKLKNGDTLDDFIARHNNEDEEEYEGVRISKIDKEILDTVLKNLGYKRCKTVLNPEYEHGEVQITIFDDRVGISVPYWEKSSGHMNLVYETTVTLGEKIGLIFWDPQVGNVMNSLEKTHHAFKYGVGKTREIEMRENKMPWWKVW
jgi:hypothetical protein